MASSALAGWHTNREARIQQLYAAHTAVGGTGRGRRYTTEQINWSITLRLAGEFQGFARDLHDESADVLLLRTYHQTPALETNFRNLLTANRQLGIRNATRSTLQQDFSRFGFFLVSDIKSSYVHGTTWLDRLDELNEARNGVAHDDTAKMRQAAGGETLALTRVRQWHSAVRGLVRACDKIAAHNLARLTGGVEPW